MKKTAVTQHVLEMLLENWGSYVMTGSWGPRASDRCGSVESRYSDATERHVWDTQEIGRLAPHKASDAALGALVERLLESACMDYRRVLLLRYGRRITGYLLCQAMQTSLAASEALLVSAKLFIHEKLEEYGYAQ